METPPIGVINATNVTMTVNNNPQYETSVTAHVPPTLQERFINYFMKKYPITKRIEVKRHPRTKRFYARAWYHGDSRKNTMYVVASHYETLVIKMEHKYQGRDIPRAMNL